VFGTQNLLVFMASAILLNLTPGQDTMYILGRSMAQGRRAGVLSVLGITSGTFVHTLAAAFGLSAILATSASAFLVVKMAGAAYLTYLGIRMLFERSSSDGRLAMFAPESDWAIYRAAFLTNLLNPKVALFILAFLPQFVDPTKGSVIVQILVLGLIFNIGGTTVNCIVAISAGAAAGMLRGSERFSRWLNRFTALVFVGLALRLAFAERR